jgi:glycerol kinase
LLTTPAYRLDDETHYALEGAIFVAGSAIKWLRDALGQFGEASETADLAAGVPDDHGVYLVPAFVGLGAPHWDAQARGAIHGLTLDSGKAHLARAALEAVAYQSHDLIDAMAADSGRPPAAMRVDGGMTANNWLCQFLADILDLPVERPANVESTALGAAYLAGIGCRMWSGLADLPGGSEAEHARFVPSMDNSVRAARLAGWHDAVRKTLA